MSNWMYRVNSAARFTVKNGPFGSCIRLINICRRLYADGAVIQEHETTEVFSPQKQERKILKVSILGEPNSGKSTFINNLIRAKVSIVTNVPHTTRRALTGVYTQGSTQIVLSDTPGVVTYEEGRRLKMDRLQITTPQAISEVSDIMAVMVDVSKKKRRERIHQSILEILHQHTEIPSILILNKIDLLGRKGVLLALSNDLLKDREKDVFGYKDTGGYSGFEHIFMVSSLTGDGIPDVRDYFMARAKEGPWDFPEDIQLDASVDEQISEIIREKILMLFDKEIPWQFKQETIILEEDLSGAIKLCKRLLWPRESQRRYVLSKINEIHHLVKEDLEKLFDRRVKLTIDIGIKKKMTKQDLHM